MKMLPLATNWKTIGVLLGLPKHTIDGIQADEDGVKNQMIEMLSEWLRRVDPPPTWTALAKAVEFVDERQAEEIRSSCLDV